MSSIPPASDLPKSTTGIVGLDQITGGGIPSGRPTLVCGGAGCGKTLLAIEFLVHGAVDFDEPGVFMAFEETESELSQNAKSLGFDLDQLVEQQRMVVDFVRIERSEVEENGEYDLEGLFVRLNYAIESIGAKRVVLDTIETLFSGLSNAAILRAELRRLFRWLKSKGVTAVITGERGDGSLTRQGLEEYVSDCVILLDHRVAESVSTRRLRVVKYRGSTHGTNEYPFLIDENGITVMPITALGLQHRAVDERVPSGISALDAMLGGKGVFRGSSVLISGTAGCGKTSVAAHFVQAACNRGERSLYFAFEESTDQILRNMRSIGIDLQPGIDQGLLQILADRATLHGLERHLVRFMRQVELFKPSLVVVDPVSSLLIGGDTLDANAMVVRLIDFLKSHGVTALMTNLTSGDAALEKTSLDISSLIDTWLLLRDTELGGERNRLVYVLKSRGMAHSNQLREFLITDQGVELRDVYIGPQGVLTGSMRIVQEARDDAERSQAQLVIDSRRRELERRQDALEARIALLRSEYEIQSEEINQLIAQEAHREKLGSQMRQQMAQSRGKSR